MLSIVLTFCDKDFYLLEKNLKNISDNVKIKHEVILVDNRVNNTEDIPCKELYNLVLKFDNKSNFSRYKAVDYANGERLWFIDSDDSILKISNVFEKYLYYSETIIEFSYYKEDSINKESFALWNKWLKTSICKKVFSLFLDLEIYNNEDIFITRALLKINNSYQFINEPIYIYNYKNSAYYNIIENYNFDNFKKMYGNYKNLKKAFSNINDLKDFYYCVSLCFCSFFAVQENNKNINIDECFCFVFNQLEKQDIICTCAFLNNGNKKMVLHYYKKFTDQTKLS